MVRLGILVMLAVAAFGQQHRIERYEIVDNGRLFATFAGERKLLSTRATRAWNGWTPNILIYAEAVDGGFRLRWYDTLTRNAHTIGNDPAEVTDVITVRLSSGNYAVVAGLREPGTGAPAVILATPEFVFHRESNAAFGTAANDAIEIRRYNPADVASPKTDLSLVRPTVIAIVPLTASTANAAGIYEAVLPAADASSRTVTLNLRPDGSATLVSAFEGKGTPTVLRGRWTQKGPEVRVEFTGTTASAPMTWIASAVGLTPRGWDTRTWGSMGIHLRRKER